MNRGEIKVKVAEYGDRPFYMMRYRHPEHGRYVSKSTEVPRGGKKQRALAERQAALWEAELQSGEHKPVEKITWQEFRQRYEEYQLIDGRAAKTLNMIATVFNSIDRISRPTLLASFDRKAIDDYTQMLRGEKVEAHTIGSYLAVLRAALRWAVDKGLLQKAPRIKRPKAAKTGKAMKGRPITGEEFDRMLAKVGAHFKDPKDGPESEITIAWKRNLRGLWLSGLRLGEAADLRWDGDSDDGIIVDLKSFSRPMLIIPGEFQKNSKDDTSPITPDFYQFLMETPEDERTGYVFNFAPFHSRRVDNLSTVICSIGRLAGVKVKTYRASGRIKYASAHDLRRSFGDRWSKKVMPPVLMQLMRHESIETTMRHYVDRNAESAADVIWQTNQGKSGNSIGNSGETLKNTDAVNPWN